LTSRTTLSKASCFPFDKVFGGSLLGDALSVSPLIGFKLTIGNGEGAVEKKMEFEA
jgi:hypothetical protein